MDRSQHRQINAVAAALLEHGWTVRLVTTTRLDVEQIPVPHLVVSANCSRPTEYVLAPASERHQLQVWARREQQMSPVGLVYDAEEAHETLRADCGAAGGAHPRHWRRSA
jgi:hypothetical protein